MIDLVTFLIPRITFFLLGSIIGSLIYIIYYILDMMTRTTSITYSLIRENLIKSKLIKLRFGFILSFLEFYAEFFIVSYPDIINSLNFFVFIAISFLLIN